MSFGSLSDRVLFLRLESDDSDFTSGEVSHWNAPKHSALGDIDILLVVVVESSIEWIHQVGYNGHR